MVYTYVAYNESGALVRGRLNAASEDAASQLLSYVGYQVVNLKLFMPFLRIEKVLPSFFHVKTSEIVLFYRELALLLESGINIVTALELLRTQATNRMMRKALDDVMADLRSGNSLSAALRKHPEIFPTIYCRLLSVGEQTGGLETMLRQIADYMNKEELAAKNIKGALMYPIITTIVTFIVVSILVTFVLPAFGDLYGSLGVDMPMLAKTLIGVSQFAKNNAVYIFGSLAAIGFFIYGYSRTAAGKYKKDKLIVRLPIIGRVALLGELARFCRSMSLLFHAGLPLTEAMPLIIQSCNNRVIAKGLLDVQEGMVKGEGLSAPMAKNELFLPMMVQMVKVGEETGNLDTTLQAVAQAYETEAEDKTRNIIALIQPAMTLIIGLVVGLVALSLTTAMYSIYGQGGF